jgi:hypothetical protein
MRWSVGNRYLLAGLAGAGCGFLAFVFFGNLEDSCYYRIRSMVTHETTLSEITRHPADRWIIFVIFATFIVGGGALGTCNYWLRQSKKKRRQ